MYTIKKSFSFEASHRLDHLPSWHKCHNLHGHSYQVDVFLKKGGLNRDGFVVDFAEMDRFKNEYIKHPLGVDHSNLNDKFDFITSSENLAKYFHDRVQEIFPNCLVKVRVSETRETWAEYSGRW